MSEHEFVAILGIAFTVIFLGGLLGLTRLPEDGPEGQHEEEVNRQQEETRHEPAQAARAAVGASARGVSDVAARLRELAKLREEGILTEEEYKTKRKRLADEL